MESIFEDRRHFSVFIVWGLQRVKQLPNELRLTFAARLLTQEAKLHYSVERLNEQTAHITFIDSMVPNIQRISLERKVSKFRQRKRFDRTNNSHTKN